MHDRPNDPEYCQGIYDAAKKVVEHYNTEHLLGVPIFEFLTQLDIVILNLKRALEGKG